MHFNPALAYVHLVVVSLALLASFHTCEGVMITSDVRKFPFLNRITLTCRDEYSIPITSPVTFHRTITLPDNNNNSTIITEQLGDFTNYTIDGSLSIVTFNLTLNIEGYYTCTNLDTNETSSNSIALVAQQYLDPSFTLPQLTVAQLGQPSPPMSCGFKPGALPQYTNIQWWRGISLLNTSHDKYNILPNYTLVINDMELTDISDGYYCSIQVNEPVYNHKYNNSSPDVSLQVYSDLKLFQSLRNFALPAGDSITLNCTAEGIPAPEIKWLINGRPSSTNPRYITHHTTTLGVSSYIVTSSLTITGAASSADSGLLQCISYLTGSDNALQVDSETSRIAILDHNFKPQVNLSENNQLTLSFILPAVISELFNLKIRYRNTDNPNEYYNSTLSSYSFINTDNVNYYAVPADKLPPNFDSFQVQLALEVFGITGLYSDLSPPIVVPLSPATVSNSSINIPTASNTIPTSSSIIPTTTAISATAITASASIVPSSSSCACTVNISLIIITSILGSMVIVLLVILAVLVMYFCFIGNKRYSQNLPKNDSNEDFPLPLNPLNNAPGSQISPHSSISTAASNSNKSCNEPNVNETALTEMDQSVMTNHTHPAGPVLPFVNDFKKIRQRQQESSNDIASFTSPLYGRIISMKEREKREEKVAVPIMTSSPQITPKFKLKEAAEDHTEKPPLSLMDENVTESHPITDDNIHENVNHIVPADNNMPPADNVNTPPLVIHLMRDSDHLSSMSSKRQSSESKLSNRDDLFNATVRSMTSVSSFREIANNSGNINSSREETPDVKEDDNVKNDNDDDDFFIIESPKH